MSSSSANNVIGRGWFWWALLTLIVTLPQLWIGSLVTTYSAGMADPIWPTPPWAYFELDPVLAPFGLKVEHLHRTVGSVVGCFVIVLAVGLWLSEPRRHLKWAAIATAIGMVVTLALGFAFRDSALWVLCVATCLAAVVGFGMAAWKLHDRTAWLRWLGLVALAGVIFQGLLGGFRVKLDALFGPNLRVIHGSIAQVYFAFLAGLTWLLAQEPRARGLRSAPVGWLRGVASAAVVLVCMQVVLGALLRHSMMGLEQSLWQRGHLLVAFSVVAVTGWLLTLMNGVRKSDPRAGRLMVALGVLVGLQVLFGVEAWMMRFTRTVPSELAPVTSIGEVIVRSAHVLTGAGVFAITTVVALWAYGTGATEVRLSAAPPLEGAA